MSFGSQLSSIGMENIFDMIFTFEIYQGHRIKNLFTCTSLSSDFLNKYNIIRKVLSSYHNLGTG